MERLKNYLLVNTTTKQTIIKNTFWLFIGEAGLRVLKAIIFIYAVRKLGVTEWGLFSYALALMSMFYIISDIGLNSVLTKKTALNNTEQKEYISTGFFLKLGLSIISSLSILSLLFFLKNDNAVRLLMPITALLFFFDTIKEFGFSINRAFEKMEKEAIIKLLTTIILAVLGFIFIRIKPIASSFIYAYAISSGIGVIIIYINIKDHFNNLFSNFKKRLLIPIWKEAWPIGITGALGTVMASIDMVILGWFQNPEQIGLYSTAQKPVQMIYLIPVLIGTSILPAFSRFAINNKEKMKKITNNIVNWSFAFTIPAIVLCLLLGGPIFNFVFGEEYNGSIIIFKIMSFAVLTSAPAGIISKAIFAEGKQKRLIQFIIISLLVNIILCLLLIPKFGIYGAAISVTIAQTIGNTFLIIKYNKILK